MKRTIAFGVAFGLTFAGGYVLAASKPRPATRQIGMWV